VGINRTLVDPGIDLQVPKRIVGILASQGELCSMELESMGIKLGLSP
jgi:hypothetical protein